MNHLKTHPAVFSKLHTHDIQVHGWMYDIKTGNVEIYDEKQTRFITV